MKEVGELHMFPVEVRCRQAEWSLHKLVVQVRLAVFHMNLVEELVRYKQVQLQLGEIRKNLVGEVDRMALGELHRLAAQVRCRLEPVLLLRK